MQDVHTYILYLIPVVSIGDMRIGFSASLLVNCIISHTVTDGGRLAIIMSFA